MSSMTYKEKKRKAGQLVIRMVAKKQLCVFCLCMSYYSLFLVIGMLHVLWLKTLP